MAGTSALGPISVARVTGRGRDDLPDTGRTSSWIRKRRGLPETALRLRDRPFRVGFLGASVTAQRPGFQGPLSEWFAARAPHGSQAIPVAFGAIGSFGSVFLADELMVDRRPDLCLIELATSDLGGHSPESEIGPAIEGLVRKLATADCEICFLHLYRADADVSDRNPILRRYEEIADHYGVPSIHLGLHFAEEVEAGRMDVGRLLRDDVHTTEDGSGLVARLVGEAITELMAAPSGELQPREEHGRKRVALPSPLHAGHYQHTRIRPVTDAMRREGPPFGAGVFRFNYPYSELQPGSEFEATVDRSLAGALVVVGPRSGVITLTTPDSTTRHDLFDRWCYYERLGVVAFNRTFDEPVSIRLALTDDPVDHTICPVDFPGKGVHAPLLRIIGLLTREAA